MVRLLHGYFMGTLPSWIGPFISLTTLIVGGAGWWAYFLTRRKETQQRYLTLLEGFLEPLQTILTRNKKAFEQLCAGHEQEVHRLEYFPSRLRQVFESLPSS